MDRTGLFESKLPEVMTVVETEVEPTPLTLEVRGFVPIGTVVDGNEG